MGPQGGKKDETPPRLLKSIPAPNATKVQSQIIQLHFDEYIQLEDVYNNVTVSPPQRKMPVIKLVGKKITVELRDTLQENTTYTIDFGNAIADNNEKNILKNFSFAFATGAEIDTLKIFGTVLNAQTLDPVAGGFVGIYDNLSDTAFTTMPFLRYTKSDANGRFSIKNVREGNFHVYAMSENWNDAYHFDLKNPVSIAFADSIIQPLSVSANDTLKIADSIRFTNLILLQYEEIKEVDTVIVEANRERKEKFTLKFNQPQEKFPAIETQNFELTEENFTWRFSPKNDEITFWLDSTLAKIDTLNFFLRHLDEKTDSIEISLSTKQTKTDNPVKITTNIVGGKLEYYDSLKIFFDFPVKDEVFEKIHLRPGRDTLDMPIRFFRQEKDDCLNTYAIAATFNEGENYTLTIDSAAVFDVFGKALNKTVVGFKYRPLSEYSTLALDLQPFDERIVVELLNEKDQAVRQTKIEAGNTYFDYIEPGAYYLRLFIDENANETWDGGKYTEHRQPEKIFYYPKKISLRANWEVQEDWNYLAVPFLQQKPQELKGKSATQKK